MSTEPQNKRLLSITLRNYTHFQTLRYSSVWFHQNMDTSVLLPSTSRTVDVTDKVSALVKNGTLKVIPGAPHGLCTTHADIINEELLAFLKK